MTRPRIVAGFPEHQRSTVARLFWEAFAAKLGRLMRPEARALAFLELTLCPTFAVSALDTDDRVLGVAGFKTAQGGLVSSGYRELARAYGWPGALWRAPLLDLTERPLEPGQMLLDGVFVSRTDQGRGIGTALIGRVIAEAEARGCEALRLDVVDSNPRAAALYRRLGFIAQKEERLGVMRFVLGVRTSTSMIYRISP